MTRRLLRDDVHDFLRDAIVEGALRPGQVLISADIERTTGASQPPVRDAFHLLRAEGFVEVLPQRVTRVRRLDASSFRDAMAVARELMTAVVRRRVSSLGRGDLERLRRYRDVHTASPDAEVEAIRAGELLESLARPFLRHEDNAILDRVAGSISLHLRWVANSGPLPAAALAWGPMRALALVAAAELQDATAAIRVLDDWFDEQLPACIALIETADEPEPCSVADDLDRIPHQKITLGRSFLRDQAFDTLVEKIADGTLAPGERLREDELMRWLGISRSPLREAMTRLESVALVESQPGKYTRVMPADPRRSRSGREFLTLLGGMVLSRARLDDVRRADLDGRAALVAEAAQRQEPVSFIREVNDYMRQLAEYGGNSAVVTILDHVQPGLFRGLASADPLDFARMSTSFASVHRALLVEEVEDAHGFLREFYGV